MRSPCPEGFSKQGGASAQTWICNLLNYNLWSGGGQYGGGIRGWQRTLPRNDTRLFPGVGAREAGSTEHCIGSKKHYLLKEEIATVAKNAAQQ
ncbi:MAG: hypothetical protein WBB55_12770 [Anaerolineales bacterium]